MINWIRNHRGLSAGIAGIVVAGAVFVIVWFEPQKLFIDERVDEPLPTVVATTTTTTPTTTTTAAPSVTATTSEVASTTTTTTTTVPPQAVVVHESSLINSGKDGTGKVLVIEQPDGSRLIRFEDLDVSNGPDLVIILSKAELTPDRDAYHLADFVSLGDLKGNQGNQNYEISADIDLAEYRTVAIWCRRFNYTFNAATIS